MKKHWLCFFFFFWFSVCLSQKEANHWYFGYAAGLDFNSGSPVLDSAGQIGTYEGCSVISDAAGQLLFYTDGKTIWNKNHSIMPNGTGLSGNSSSTQSALIVPKPGSDTIYYVFTVAAEAEPDGLRFSEVDLTLGNGQGDVTANKNILLRTPVCEKLTAVRNEAGNGFWVVCHDFGNSNFISFQITDIGINTIPVISSSGSVITGNGTKATGYLKICPDGSKMISCNSGTNVELFDFDTSTGMVTNSSIISTSLINYGCEFSQSGTIAYIGCGNIDRSNRIVQYDLTASDVAATATVIFTTSDALDDIGALQLAPDGKIYIANYNKSYLSSIENPNILGEGCNFVLIAVDLGNMVSQIGLPQFVQSYFKASIFAQDLCFGSETTFMLITGVPPVNVLWDFGDGSTSNSISPVHQYVSPGNYHVTATVTNGLEVSADQIDITIYASPSLPATINNNTVCVPAGMTFDLTQYDTIILGAQSASTFQVAYFLTQSDAISHINILPDAFLLPVGATIAYAKIYNSGNPECCQITSFTITNSQLPAAVLPVDYIICDSLPYDGLESFDLSSKNIEILNSLDADNFTISYHASQEDADLNVSSLQTPYVNILPEETIYARVENKANPNCFNTLSFNLKVIQMPEIREISDFVLCDDPGNDAVETFDLSLKVLEILNGYPPSAFKVDFFINYSDAQANLNPITIPIENSINNQDIYYSISAIGQKTCRSVGSYKLFVLPYVKANPVSDLYYCNSSADDNHGVFDLSALSSDILGQQPSGQYIVNFYNSLQDATAGTNQLPLMYQNSLNPETVFARVENNLNHTCFALTSFQVKVINRPMVHQIPDMYLCDNNNDATELFDLLSQETAALGSQDPQELIVSFYLSYADAVDGVNVCEKKYTNRSNPQTIYLKIENKLSSACFDISSFKLHVMPKPVLNLEDDYVLCDGETIMLSAPGGYTHYEWSNGATSSSTTISRQGIYSLVVTMDYNSISCSAESTINVRSSNEASVIKIEKSDWTVSQNSIIIHVAGNGSYEFSIDGIHYQDSNEFNDLKDGEIVVYVRDKNGCGITQDKLFLLMYPKFFTPNHDGANDIWQIGSSFSEPDMETLIFDRYGKIIKAFRGLATGWDGTYNGEELPSTDYWFLVKRNDGKEFRGHFALIR